MKQLLFSSLLSIVFLLSANQAVAWKGVSGGNIVGGILLDQAEFKHATPLAGADLLTLVNSQLSDRMTDLPMLKALTVYNLIGGTKRWYLQSEPLDENCRDESPVKQNIIIAACQDKYQVQISQQVWKTLADAQKADLILHEILTAMMIAADGDTTAVEPATNALLDPKESADDVRSYLVQLGFPDFQLESEVIEAMVFLKLDIENACSAQTDLDAYYDYGQFRAATAASALQTRADGTWPVKKNGIDNVGALALASEASLEALNDKIWGPHCSLGQSDASIESLVYLGWQNAFKKFF